MASSRSEHPSLGFLPSSMLLQPRSAPSTGNNSPIEPPNGSSMRSPFGNTPNLNSVGGMPGTTRSGAGSPSHEQLGSSSRLYSKRAREIQAQEGLPVNVWGPPTSGNSTPLRENIPESPTDGFPDYINLPTPESLPSGRRGRAGTVPSRFSPAATGGIGGIQSILSKASRPAPSISPYKSPSPSDYSENTSASNSAALLSRLRAGSVPQRLTNYPPVSGQPFGPSVFSTNWSSGRERTSTLASIASLPSNEGNSPARSTYSREGHGEGDMQIRTLDYLGLVDTPQQPRASLVTNPFLVNLIDQSKQASRYRSYSVNAAAKYEDDDEYSLSDETQYEKQQRLQMEIEHTNAAIAEHNAAVQAYERHASANRPRAKTMGVLNAPPNPKSFLNNYYPTTSRMEHSMTASDFNQAGEYEGLSEAVQSLNLEFAPSKSDDPNNLEGPSRSLWLGSIPSSTTQTTLVAAFQQFGKVDNARVLTHKNCGFVNFEDTDSAIRAKASMNGKEIFPGAGPIRINFAKPPSSTPSPNHDGSIPSPSPDPFTGAQSGNKDRNGTPANAGVISRPESAAPPPTPSIAELGDEIMSIVKDLGASDDDLFKIQKILRSALEHNNFEDKIEHVSEPSQSRIHDAPKLREIRKRIDNNNWTKEEIENVAREMLPEIAELSADYLGNTVVQKLFEICSEEVRDAMLIEVAPHLAKIGCHKNGTWAAQKILDTLKLPHQQRLAVDSLRRYAPPLFLDQFGNYVLQACLRYGSPYNDYVYETMLVKLWDLGQERFGARAMRACLESHYATKEQLRLLAAAIAVNSVQLSTNSNGALLLTWFLDTCNFPKRRTVLAPLLLKHLVYLGTHKVAYLTVLKVVNQRNEPEARSLLINALFFEDNNLLEDVLNDATCGSTFIHKVLTAPFWESEAQREKISERIKSVLLKIKAGPSQGYQRLMTELKMLGQERNRSVGPREHAHPTQERQRPVHQQQNGHSMQPQTPQHMQQILQQTPQQQYQSHFYPQMGQQYGMDMQRTDSMDSNMTAYPQYGLPNAYSGIPAAALPISPIQMTPVQPYQTLFARQPPPQMGNYYGNVNVGTPGYSQGYTGAPSQMVDPYARQMMPNASPMVQQQQMNQQPQYPGQGYPMNGYPYQGMGQMQNVGGMVGYMPEPIAARGPNRGRR